MTNDRDNINKIRDFRSDTVTRPTAAMKEAMMKAEVGDDVYGEDPTVNLLQEKVAKLLGKEAALFVSSGTLANQLAIGTLTRPGDELLCHETSHVHRWEGGGPARLWGVTVKTVKNNNKNSQQPYLTVEDFEQHGLSPKDPHYSKTQLICLENTLNRLGGKIHPLHEIKKIAEWGKSHHLKLHLDGARLWNASIQSEIPLSAWAQPFDSISLCFSKGLGAPVGSILVGSEEQIIQAKRLRKVLGGGLRQAGILAAACLYALDHHQERLAEDHHHAQNLAQQLLNLPGFQLEFDQVETNLVWVKVSQEVWGTAEHLAQKLKSYGILVSVSGAQLIRLCTHLDIHLDDIDYLKKTLINIRENKQ